VKTFEEVIAFAKTLLVKLDGVPPTLIIEGTTGSDGIELPDLPEAIKFSALEALGYTVAREDRIGSLAQLFLVAEGWRGRRNGHQLALRPQYDPERVEVVMVFHYQADGERLRLRLYDLLRGDDGRPMRLELMPHEDSGVESPTMEAFIRGFNRGRQ
jgi:hypothetical protein